MTTTVIHDDDMVGASIVATAGDKAPARHLMGLDERNRSLVEAHRARNDQHAEREGIDERGPELERCRELLIRAARDYALSQRLVGKRGAGITRARLEDAALSFEAAERASAQAQLDRAAAKAAKR